MNQEDTNEVLHFTYTNHRGETKRRRVMPDRIYFGTTPEHLEPTWLMSSFCFDRQAQRTFELKKMVFDEINLPTFGMMEQGSLHSDYELNQEQAGALYLSMENARVVENQQADIHGR